MLTPPPRNAMPLYTDRPQSHPVPAYRRLISGRYTSAHGEPARLTRTLAHPELAERQAPFGSCRCVRFSQLHCSAACCGRLDVLQQLARELLLAEEPCGLKRGWRACQRIGIG